MLTNGMSITAKGMMATIDMNDNVANNLANVNTAGYRRSHLLFKNIYDATVEQTPSAFNSGNSQALGTISMGAQTEKIVYEFSQGTLARTGRSLDVAIEGDGFFKIRDMNGNISYTRNGDFCLNNKQMLVTKDGEYVLDPLNKPIKIDLADKKIKSMNDIIVGEKGEIEIITSDQQRTKLQSIGIFDFSDKENMRSLGNAKFQPKYPEANKELKAEKYSIQQGAIEQSNSNVITEMVNMINVSRCYETLSKFMQRENELLTTTINLGRTQL